MAARGGDRTQPTARVLAAEREHQVVELRLRGVRWRPISEATGISIRGAMAAWHRALDHIRLPGAEEAKKQLLEAARLLESNLWTDYGKASEPTARATIGNAILRCQERQSKLLGCDVPTALVMQVAMNPPTESQEATVQQLKQNLTVDEMRQLMMLSAKGAGRAATLAIDVTPAPIRAPEQVARPQTSPEFDEPLPPSPEIDEPEPQATEPPIIMPPPPRTAPPTPTLREVFDRQTGGWQAEIDRLYAERGILCPLGEADPNWLVWTAKIELLEWRRDNPNPEIQRG
jgi:hypothetical protein